MRLGGGDPASLAAEGTDKPEAHDAYLRGRYFWNERTGESLRQAAERFRSAIEMDSSYAEAWSGLADTYSVMPWYLPDDSLDIASLQSRALEAARRAVELAPERALTHTSLAEAHFFNGHWQEAEREFQRAIELNSNYATGHHCYGEFLAFTGRFEDGISHLRRAVQLDPVSRIANSDLAFGLHLAGRFEQALEQAHTTIDLDPSWFRGHSRRARALARLGRWDEALDAELERALVSGGDTTGVRELYSCLRHFWETREPEPQRCKPPGDVSPATYAALGQKEPFLCRLEEHVESGEVRPRALARSHTRIGTWAGLDPRDDPRYQELMQQLGIDW